MKVVNVSVDLIQLFATTSKSGIKTNADVNVKTLIDKGMYDKIFIWNPSNCECECDKSCNIGEYLDYKTCKVRKK